MNIAPYWNGPPESANGGYTCGLVAGLLDAPSAEVTLRAPPPLDTELEIDRSEGAVRLVHETGLVAEGRVAEPPAVDPPRSVTLDEAASASRAGWERWTSSHPFPTCVVCGPDRQDGLRVFPGEVEGGVFAATWEARPEPEAVWAALDCPTSAPVANFGQGPPIVLARLHAHVERVPAEGEELVLLSWPIGIEGRKRQAASALIDAEGSVLARARALWIELRAEPA